MPRLNRSAVLFAALLFCGTAAADPAHVSVAGPLQAQPLASAPSVGAIKAGTAVNVIARKGFWAQVKGGPLTGWLKLGRLSLDGGGGSGADIAALASGRAGSAELLVATVLSVGTAYALSNVVREDRPDHSSMHAFPALPTALAGSSSSFILERYGWREGLPAFAASGFVSFALNQAKKENWYDTLASSAISAGYWLLITRKFHSRYHVTTNLTAAPGGMFASLSYDF